MLGFLLERLRAAADRRLPQHLRDARRGEDLAYQYLKRLGYKIVARNYRMRRGRGEIDLIGWDGDRLACVEVKTRASAEFGAPDRAVDREKRDHLIQAAREYARRAGVDEARVRFDIVSVILGAAPSVQLEKDAFSRRSHLPRRRH
jgi:putative endonuclease